MSMNMTVTWFCGLLLLALHFCEGAPSSEASSLSSWFNALGGNATESASWLKEYAGNATESASWLKEYAGNATESVEDAVSHLSWSCIYSIIGCAAGGLLFLSLGIHWLLLCLGFGALGPVAGSIAALCQPAEGVSFAFRCMQSTGMTFFNFWRGQMIFTATCWCIMIPLLLLGGGGAGYAGYVFLPLCQNCTMNGTICDTLNDTIVVNSTYY